MADTVTNFLKEFLSDELVVFVVSLLPILELRGGLVAAAILGVEWYKAFPICVLGNILPIPIVLLFIRQILNWLKKRAMFKKLVDKIEKKAQKNTAKVLKYKKWGLFLFVAIPLPGTGAWTGALVANFLDMRFKSAFPLILAGVFVAGLIMMILSYVAPALIF
ncbi:MAG: small multi-drug export protein [Clostridia bacterium]|nr:small multi-drug export protein [Clostridia bacterium]